MTRYEAIQQMAYALFEKSGRICGKDLDHWHEAERILAKQGGEERVRQMAYALFEKSGCVHGKDLDNWLEAMRILASQMSYNPRCRSCEWLF